MSEEQLTGATAEVAPAESAVPTGETASQEAQPEAQQGAATTEAQQSTPVNWEAEAKRYRDQFNGREGSFKQLQEQFRQTQAQLREVQQYNARIEAERQVEAQRQSNVNMRQRLARAEEDPDEARTLVGELRQQLTVAEQATITRQQLEAQAQAYADRLAMARYAHLVNDIGRRLGITEDEARLVAEQTGNDYDAFSDTFAKQIEKKLTAPLHQDYQRQLTEARKAGETEALARQRASERSPDAGSGLPSGSDDDQTFLREFNAGRSNDMRRARQLLNRL